MASSCLRFTRRILIAAVPCAWLLVPHGGAAAQDESADEPAPTQVAANRAATSAYPAANTERALASTDVARAPRRSTGGFRALWLNGGFVARATLLCLATMLTGAAYVVARRAWDQHVLFASAQRIRLSFWTAPNLYEAVRTLERHSPFRAIAEDALEAATHREGRLTDGIAPDEWIVMSLRRSVRAIETRLDAGLPFVAAVGATAPLVGLVGTVWGIHAALTDEPTEPIATAVGTTLPAAAAGLGVAVLAMLATRWLARRNARAAAAVHEFAADVQALLLAANALIPAALPARALSPGHGTR